MENAQTLMCHRNPLDRIYFGSKSSKRSYRKQQDTRKWTIRVGRADMVQAQEEHAKTTAHAEQVSHNIDSELSKSNARKQQDMHKWTTRISTRTQETRTCMRKNKYSIQKQKQKTSVPLHNSKPDKNTYRKEPVQDTKTRRK